MKNRLRSRAAGVLQARLLIAGKCLAQMQMPMCHTGDSGEIVAPAQLPAPLRLKLFSSAQEKEADLGYHEPPWYTRPASESEGAALVIAGKWAAAEAAFRRELLARPQSGFSLYGIALAAAGSTSPTGRVTSHKEPIATNEG
jgi:hypothetical protein